MKGERCEFLHQFDLEKMPLCRHGDRCKTPDCPFRHIKEEVRVHLGLDGREWGWNSVGGWKSEGGGNSVGGWSSVGGWNSVGGWKCGGMGGRNRWVNRWVNICG